MVAEMQKLPAGERAVVSMDTLEEMYGIDIARNASITYTLAGMLGNRL